MSGRTEAARTFGASDETLRDVHISLEISSSDTSGVSDEDAPAPGGGGAGGGVVFSGEIRGVVNASFANLFPVGLPGLAFASNPSNGGVIGGVADETEMEVSMSVASATTRGAATTSATAMMRVDGRMTVPVWFSVAATAPEGSPVAMAFALTGALRLPYPCVAGDEVSSDEATLDAYVSDELQVRAVQADIGLIVC